MAYMGGLQMSSFFKLQTRLFEQPGLPPWEGFKVLAAMGTHRRPLYPLLTADCDQPSKKNDVAAGCFNNTI